MMRSCDAPHRYPTTRSAARATGQATAVVLLSAVLAAVGCKSAVPAAKPKPRNVAVQVIEPVPALADTFKIIGKTEPDRTVKVIAEVPGRIENVAVTEGQTVSGDGDNASLLVELNTDLLQATLDLCRADTEFTKLEFHQLTEMFDRDAATQYELDRAETQYLMAKARQDSAAAELDRSKIYAPISGVLNSLPVEHGEYVQPGTLIAEIVDIDEIKVVVDAPELDVSYLSAGDEATVLADLRGREEKFEGEITYISKLADPGTFTSRVEITIDNADGRLPTGKMVDVRLTRRVIHYAIMVPLDAVIPRRNDRVVYVVSPQVDLAFDVPAATVASLADGDVVGVRSHAAFCQAEITALDVPELKGQDIVRLTLRIDLDDANWPGSFDWSAGQLIISLPGQSDIEIMIGPVEDSDVEPDESQPDRIIAELSGFAERREVTLGIMRGNEVQILSGLAAGDMLIIEGQQYVGPGQSVRIVPSVESREANTDAAMGADEPQQ